MTPKLFSMVSRWRWSSLTNSRSRDLRLLWSASNMSSRHMSPTSTPAARGEISKRDPAHAARRGEPAAAFDRAATRIKAEYRMPVEHHNPMEPFAATNTVHGFIYNPNGGTYTPLNDPLNTNATFGTRAMGINNAGQIVGIYNTATGVHSFLYSG